MQVLLYRRQNQDLKIFLSTSVDLVSLSKISFSPFTSKPTELKIMLNSMWVPDGPFLTD